MSVTEWLTDILPLLTATLGALVTWLLSVHNIRIAEETRAVYTRKLEDENRTLQAKLDKTGHVYRVQFEAEFQSLLVIWSKFAIAQLTMGGLRPSMDLVFRGENPQDRLDQKLKAFADAINELKAAVFQHSPFYPEDLYKDLLDAIQVCGEEYTEVSVEKENRERPKDWYTQGNKRYGNLVSKGKFISSKIRQRIENLLSVQEGITRTAPYTFAAQEENKT